MNTYPISNTSKTLFALPILIAVLSVGLAHAGAPRVEQLPRVVITGKSLQSKAGPQVVTLPRVVVLGHRAGDIQVASCNSRRQAEIAQSSTQQC